MFDTDIMCKREKCTNAAAFDVEKELKFTENNVFCKNCEHVFYEYLKKADDGDVQKQLNVAKCYYFGHGIEQSIEYVKIFFF